MARLVLTKHDFCRTMDLTTSSTIAQGIGFRFSKQLTGNRGVEFVIDPIGGAHWKKSFRRSGTRGPVAMFWCFITASAEWIER